MEESDRAEANAKRILERAERDKNAAETLRKAAEKHVKRVRCECEAVIGRARLECVRAGEMLSILACDEIQKRDAHSRAARAFAATVTTNNEEHEKEARASMGIHPEAVRAVEGSRASTGVLERAR